MLNEVHTDAPGPEAPPDHTVPQIAQDCQHLLAQLRHLLHPVLEQMRAAPAPAPEAVPGEPLSPLPQTLAGFTVQECRIATLIAQGLSTEAIAAQLYIAPTTVKVHRRNIRKKLGLVGPHQRLQPYLARQEPPPTPGGHAAGETAITRPSGALSKDAPDAPRSTRRPFLPMAHAGYNSYCQR